MRRSTPAQDVERMRRVAHQIVLLGRLGPGGAEHQPVLQRVLARELQVLLSQRGQVLHRIVEGRARIQVRGEAQEAATHDLGEQVVAAGVVLVRRLVRHPQLARHVAQAQVLDAPLGDHLLRGHHAGFAQFERRFGFGLLAGHAAAKWRSGWRAKLTQPTRQKRASPNRLAPDARNRVAHRASRMSMTRSCASAATSKAASSKRGARNSGRTWLDTPHASVGSPTRLVSTRRLPFRSWPTEIA